MTVFAIGAVVGFKSSAWIVVGGLAAHGVFDVLQGNILELACQNRVAEDTNASTKTDPG